MEDTLQKLVEIIDDLRFSEKSRGLHLETLGAEQSSSLKIGSEKNNLIDLCSQLIANSLPTANPRFAKQLYSGASSLSIVAETLIALLNTSMARHEIAPFFSALEKEVVDFVAQNFKVTKKCLGLTTPGGSYGNLLSLQLARYKKDPQHLEHGAGPRYVAYISEHAHYSLLKSFKTLGFGAQNLVQVKSNEQFQMDPHDLEEKIKKTISQGLIPFYVALTAGTTVHGAFDSPSNIEKIAQKYSLWVHVDAAWGGAAAFSPNHRDKIASYHFCDSFVFDAHKVFSLSLHSSLFFTPHEDLLKECFSGGGESYLFKRESTHPLDSGEYSLQCGRRADIVKFWLFFKTWGRDGLAHYIEKLFTTKKEIAHYIDECDFLERITPSPYLNLCYRYRGDFKTQEEQNHFHQKKYQQLKKENQAMISLVQEKGEEFFRLVVVTPEMNLDLFKTML